MTKNLKEFVKNKNNLIIIVLAGVLLMIIAWPVKKETKINNTSNINKVTESENLSDKENTELVEEEYVDRMEKKVEEILCNMEGAGQVKVVITIRSSTEKVVEKDLPVNRSNTTEEDAEGGKRTVNNVDAQENTVYSQTGNDSQPYVIKTVSPQVEGVLVLAEGAGSGEVSKNISDAIQVLFGIEAHRIKVIKLECIGSNTD